MSEHRIGSALELLERVREDCSDWQKTVLWYRGQSVDAPLLPKVFRAKFKERDLVGHFRLRAPVLGTTPKRDHFDEWLFLMQHTGLPTRLLDWTEGVMIALFFAVCNLADPTVPSREDAKPVVWVLHPLRLNSKSVGKDHFPLAYRPDGIENIHRAFGVKEEDAHDLPVAIYPSNVHMRMAVQRSCFTVHGKKEGGIDKLLQVKLVKKGYLRKYPINAKAAYSIWDELGQIGISHSTLFPDHDGLSKELAYRLCDPNVKK